jgi:ribulose-5-phosphate 4-epimerase/fuculose-1-phosphate aldolase
MTKITDLSIRTDLAYAYRILHHLKLDDHTYTHLSHRTSHPTQAFILEFGLRFEEVTAENLLTLDFTDPNGLYNLTGFIIHGAVYHARPEIQAIFHVHTPEIVAVSTLPQGLLPLSQWALHLYDSIGYYDYDSLTLDTTQGSDLIKALDVHPVLMMRNHGALICGKTIQEAMFFTYHLLQACKTQCLSLGSAHTDKSSLIMPSPEVCIKARNDLLAFEPDLGKRDWASWKRLIDTQ